MGGVQEGEAGPYAWDRHDGEGPEAHAALLEYLKLGPERSLSTLADRTGRNVSQLKRWSAEHGWQERSVAFDTHKSRLAQGARDSAVIAEAAEWEARRLADLKASYEVAVKLRAKAEEMLGTALGQSSWTMATAASAAKAARELAREAIEAALDDGFDPLEATPEECVQHLRKEAARRAQLRELLGKAAQA
jgi:hypothetical protein